MNYETFKQMKLSEDPELKKEYDALQRRYEQERAKFKQKLNKKAEPKIHMDWPNEIRIAIRSKEMFSALKTLLLNQKAEFYQEPGNIFSDVKMVKEPIMQEAKYFICYNGEYYRVILDNSNDDFNQMLIGSHRFPIACSRVVFDIVDISDREFGSLIYPQYIRPTTFDGKRKLAAVVAVSKNGVIGIDGDLAYHNPDDLKFVRDLTMGLPIIMGYNTFKSMKFRTLPGRMNILFARISANLITMSDRGQMDESVRSVHTVLANGTTFSNRPYHCWYSVTSANTESKRAKELVDEIKQYMTFDRAFVFGGAGVYKTFAQYIDEWYVTEYDDIIKTDSDRVTVIPKYWDNEHAILSTSYKNTIQYISEEKILEGHLNDIPYTTTRYVVHWRDQ